MTRERVWRRKRILSQMSQSPRLKKFKFKTSKRGWKSECSKKQTYTTSLRHTWTTRILSTIWFHLSKLLKGQSVSSQLTRNLFTKQPSYQKTSTFWNKSQKGTQLLSNFRSQSLAISIFSSLLLKKKKWELKLRRMQTIMMRSQKSLSSWRTTSEKKNLKIACCFLQPFYTENTSKKRGSKRRRIRSERTPPKSEGKSKKGPENLRQLLRVSNPWAPYLTPSKFKILSKGLWIYRQKFSRSLRNHRLLPRKVS